MCKNMFKIIVILSLARYVLPQDDILDSLYGVTGQNRLTVCAEEEVDCEGALWKPRWVLTRTSCLFELPVSQLAVIKGDKGCTDFIHKIEWNPARGVYVSFPHPDLEVDLSLLYLEKPFESVEKLANASLAHEVLKEYEPWMQKTVHTYFYGNSHAKWSSEVASPVRMFIITGVLPSAALIIFFLFILFFTSSNKNSAYEHRSLSFDKDLNV